MEQNNTDEMEIDLREIFAVLLGWLWLILLVAILVGASAFAFSRFVITPTYESTTRIVILNKQSTSNTLTYSDLQMGTQLTKDYEQLIKSRTVVEQVLATFGMDMSYEAFLNKLDVTTPSDTRIIDITVTDPDPLLAKELVDEVRNVAAERIKEVMDVEAVNLVDEGNVAYEPSNPNVVKWTLLGLLLGGFLAAAVVVIRFLLDDTIKSSEDVEKYLGLSTLALIPVVTTEEEEKSSKKRKRKKKDADDEQTESEDEDLTITDLSEND
ncbi:MAG: YveK family protein [Lachnospiraceae bacterium]